MSRFQSGLRLRIIGAAMALAVVLTGCGGSSTTTSSTTDQMSPQASDSQTMPDTSTTDDDTQTDSSDEWVPLDMKVRVVNLWYPSDSTTSGSIDVYNEFARPGFGAKKLVTVAPGTATEFFAPEAKKLFLDQGSKDFKLTFYPEGKNLDADQLMSQNEDWASGLVLTYVITAASKDSGSTGASVQVFADAPGSSTAWETGAPWAPPAGKATLLLMATALQYAGADPNIGPAYLASTTAGKCINFMDSADGTMHDEDSSSFGLISGTGGMTIVLDPGEQIRINKAPPTSSVKEACASKPVIPAMDPGLAAGGRAYGFLWGSDPDAPKLMILPAG